MPNYNEESEQLVLSKEATLMLFSNLTERVTITDRNQINRCIKYN
ncbi:hypothetical protein [Lysinibacillus sp. NPDC047702]